MSLFFTNTNTCNCEGLVCHCPTEIASISRSGFTLTNALTVAIDGKVTFHPGCTADEASRLFWERLPQFNPLKERNEALEAKCALLAASWMKAEVTGRSWEGDAAEYLERATQAERVLKQIADADPKSTLSVVQQLARAYVKP